MFFTTIILSYEIGLFWNCKLVYRTCSLPLGTRFEGNCMEYYHQTLNSEF
jgi:hypothetical protein